MRRRSYAETAACWARIRKAHQAQIRAAEAELSAAVRAYDKPWVVLDDDPTGIQTVHDLPVYTDSARDTLSGAFRRRERLFYLLTNSRAMSAAETESLHCAIAVNCLEAAGATQQFPEIPFGLISRGDSTLRGHYPLETDTLASSLSERTGIEMDGLILAPFFEAGGRFTIDDVHYVRFGDDLIPAGETEYARDETFGYTHSDLPGYILEKTGGRWRAEEILSVPLDMLCRGDVAAVEALLCHACHGQPVIVNALSQSDLRVFCAGLYRALAAGHRFLYRTAADFVKAVGDIPDRPLLTRTELLTGANDGGGLILVGSHTDRTTAQLEALRGMDGLLFLPFTAGRVLEGSGALHEETLHVRRQVEEGLQKGQTPVVYTERQVLHISGESKEAALSRSVAISEALCAVAQDLECPPAWIIGKGGITSSDLGVRTLQVRRAWVLGQILPGIPVWQTDETSRYPGIPYIIFPGNVGERDTLRRIVSLLKEKKNAD